MAATQPEQISHAFAEALRNDDLETLLALYEPEARYLMRSGENDGRHRGNS